MDKRNGTARIPLLGGALGLAAALTLLPAALGAQGLAEWDRPQVDFEVRSGASTPSGEFSRYAQPGFYTGLGVAYWFNDALALRADGSFHSLGGVETRDRLTMMPDMRLWHGAIGIEYDWTQAEEAPVTFQTAFGVGTSQLNTDFYEGATAEPVDTQESFTTLSLGVDVGLALTEDIRFVFGTKGYLGLPDEEQLESLASVNAAAEPTDRLLTYAHSAGLRIDLPN